MGSQSKKIAVIGLGKTGFSCVGYLIKQGHQVSVLDTRENPPYLSQLQNEFPKVPFHGGSLLAEWLAAADEIMLSPGLSLQTPEIMREALKGKPIIGDVEVFARAAKAPIIAITGSNGKTTVTTLMGKVIAEAGYSVEVCGNIGEPVLDVLQRAVPDFYVIELSSFQLETTNSLKAKAAVVLNVTPDHMDRYDDIELYRQAKQRIYDNAEFAIINLEEPETWQNYPNLPSKKIGFTLKTPEKNQFGVLKDDGKENGKNYLAFGTQKIMATDELILRGKHHYQNALAIFALSYSIGLEFEPIRNILKSFAGIKHRCQRISQKFGIDWYNDSKATNVGATVASIETVAESTQGEIYLILGGDAKNADLSSIKNPIKEFVAHVMLLGKDAERFADLLHGVVPMTRVIDLKDAVFTAKKMAKSTDAVLLAPACASFDMFKDYQHRGDVFTQSVEELQ